MRTLARFLVDIFFATGLQLGFLVLYLLAWPLSLLGRRGVVVFRQMAGGILRFLFWGGRLQPRWSGVEKLAPGRKTILLANRPCRNAPFYLTAYFPASPALVISSRLLRFPVVGRVFRQLGFIPYPRQPEERRAATAFALGLVNALKHGDPVVIFVETFLGNSRRSRQQLDRLIEVARQTGSDLRPLLVTTRGIGNRPNRDIFLLGEVDLELGAPWPLEEKELPGRIRAFFNN